MKLLDHISERLTATLTLIALFFALSSTASAQEYQIAVGLRAGGTSGLTVKGFVSPNTALEAIISGYPYGPAITLLGEAHSPIAGPLSLYLGGGGHIRSGKWRANDNDFHPFYGPGYYEADEVGLGVDGILGLELKVPVLPLAFSLDTKPFIDFTNRNNVYVGYDLGLGIKLAF